MLLREKDRAALYCIFTVFNLPAEVWAYGSRVNGNAHAGSDLDLVIRSADLTPLPADSVVQLREAIADSTIPILVELRDWAVLPESFHRSILAGYEMLWSNVK